VYLACTVLSLFPHQYYPDVTKVQMTHDSLEFRFLINLSHLLKACTHRDEYQRALFISVFQRVFCVHTQVIFTDDEPSEHANSFPDIRWRLM